MAGAPDRVGVLVIRVWLEPEASEPRLRARLSITPDITGAGTRVQHITTAQIDEICAEVRRFFVVFTGED